MTCQVCKSALPIEVGIIPAPRRMRDEGLLAWASVRVGVFGVDGLTVRLTLKDEFVVEWPMRRSGSGELHAVAYLTDEQLIRTVEARVLAQFVDVMRKERMNQS